MSEINNNKDILSRCNSVAKTSKNNSNTSFQGNNTNDEYTIISNLSGLPSETLGRSQVSNPDNLVNDMNTMRQNPKLTIYADEFFNYALRQAIEANIPNPYEHACLTTASFFNEFAKKSPQVQI